MATTKKTTATKSTPKSKTNGSASRPVIHPSRLGEFNAASAEHRKEDLGIVLIEGGRVWLCRGEEWSDVVAPYNAGNYSGFVFRCLLDEERADFAAWLAANPMPIGKDSAFHLAADWLVEQYTGMAAGKA